jgi:hypothetical protein
MSDNSPVDRDACLKGTCEHPEHATGVSIQ